MFSLPFCLKEPYWLNLTGVTCQLHQGREMIHTGFSVQSEESGGQCMEFCTFLPVALALCRREHVDIAPQKGTIFPECGRVMTNLWDVRVGGTKYLMCSMRRFVPEPHQLSSAHSSAPSPHNQIPPLSLIMSQGRAGQWSGTIASEVEENTEGSHFPSLTTTTGGDLGLRNLSATKWHPDGDHSCSPVPAVPVPLHLRDPRRTGNGADRAVRAPLLPCAHFPFISPPSAGELLVLTFMLCLCWQRKTGALGNRCWGTAGLCMHVWEGEPEGRQESGPAAWAGVGPRCIHRVSEFWYLSSQSNQISNVRGPEECIVQTDLILAQSLFKPLTTLNLIRKSRGHWRHLIKGIGLLLHLHDLRFIREVHWLCSNVK